MSSEALGFYRECHKFYMVLSLFNPFYHTVEFKSVRDALSTAKQMLHTSEAARSFVEKYLSALVGIFSWQNSRT